MKLSSLLTPALVFLAGTALAADWPQWRGPNRDEVSRETGLLKTWPKGGPKLLWTSEDVGIGYSGPAVVGERLYTLGSDETNDYTYALNTRTGKQVWSRAIGPFVDNGWGGGPRSTPTVDGDYLYALSASGRLNCLKKADGVVVWSVELASRDGLGGNRPGWNYSESPLVDGDKIICSPGGSKGTLAALDRKTGRVIWRSKELTDPAGYSSVIVVEVGRIRQYVQLTMRGVAGVSAKDGTLLWYYRHPGYRIAVVPTPVFHDGYVYAVAGYGAGSVLLQLSPDGKGTKAEQVYERDKMRLMDNKHGGVVRVGNHVYGYSDRGSWLCQEFKTGKSVWMSRALGRGSLTYADGHLYCYSENNGTVALVPAKPDKWQEKGRFQLPKLSDRRRPSGGVWTHPVIANGRLYLRDQELLFCYDIKDSAAR
jgi:outer membrane protein assembly factor BamB